MDTNKMREQFEAWVLRDYPNQNMRRFNNGEYCSTTVEHCWLSWQASREAVVVELPEPESPESYGVTQKDDPEQYQVLESRMGAQYSAIFKCKRAIDAQGLKVAP